MNKERIACMVSVAILIIPILACGASGNARVVRRDAAGGVLALAGDRGVAQEEAANHMAAHCGMGNYQVVAEEETVVGERTTTNASQNQDTQSQAVAVGGSRRYGRRGRAGVAAGAASSNTQTNTAAIQETTNVTEYRVTYACGQGAAPPMAAPAGAPVAQQPVGQPVMQTVADDNK